MNFKEIKYKINLATLSSPSSGRINELLVKHLTPIANELGLNYSTDKNQWFNKFNKNGIKHVIQFQKTKGNQAILIYGSCFDFLPTISGNNRIITHRTDKSTKLHLFEYANTATKKSFFKNRLLESISLHNEKDFEKTLSESLIGHKPIIEKWFKNNSSIEQNIETCLYQTNQEVRYSTHYPTLDYILSFLYSNNNKQLKANEKWSEFKMKNRDIIDFKTLESLEKKIKIC